MAGRILSPHRDFLRSGAGGGVLLLAATMAALAWANSPWADGDQDFWHTILSIGPGSWAVRKDLQHWVNDALLVVIGVAILLRRSEPAEEAPVPTGETAAA
jgi:Na+:H+ antiporter, NhaA family